MRDMASWMITVQCNFKCPYCSIWKNPSYTAIDRTKALENLKKTGRSWVIHFTGGEPLLVPDIVDFCKDLSQDFMISLDTNLSIKRRVQEFVDTINPQRVMTFHVSCHILELERLNLVSTFIENIRLLQSSGIERITVVYVLYPPLINRFENDYQKFLDSGIRLNATPFSGEYGGKSYPQSYDDRSRNLLEQYGFPLTGGIFSKGLRCRAGYSLISIQHDGTINRCRADKRNLGHIEGGFNLFQEPSPCSVEVCPCFGDRAIEASPDEIKSRLRIRS